MDVAVIIEMSEDVANVLNRRQSNGLSIRGVERQEELNEGEAQHGRIHSRVFIIRKAVAGNFYEVVLGDPKNPELVKEFMVPLDKEYVIVNL